VRLQYEEKADMPTFIIQDVTPFFSFK